MDYHVAFANRMFREKFGESGGKHCYEYCFGKTAPCEFCQAFQVFKKGQANRWIVSTIDGSVIEAYDYPFTDVDGTRMVLEVNIEITERKKVEESLRESDEKYRQVVDKLPEMVFEIDANGRVVFANLRAIEILGFSKEELEHDFDANRLVAAEDVERSREDMKHTFAEGRRCSSEYVFVRKDGTCLPVLLTSMPIIKNRQVVGARGIVVDLTERKEIEKRLNEKERLAAIGATAGMVGHDIRNPLQAIIGDTFLLRLDLGASNDNKSKSMLECLDSIDENVEYINKIVQDLQDFAKSNIPVLKETDVELVIQSVLIKKVIPDNIEVSFEIGEDAKKIRSDQNLLRRILANLVNNAVQAMPNGGSLVIFAFKKASKIVITVEDTGSGISEEIKPKIFTPLFTTKPKGQGFGLAVVKRMTEALGGTISFESEKDKGTKFIIELPI